MEARWSETWARLMDEMKLWLVGNRPEVNIVILIKWTKNANSNEVRGTVELYARDTYGQPYCRQRVTIFPASDQVHPLQITWHKLSGPFLPERRDLGTILPPSVENLRHEAREAFARMSIVPAIRA